MNKRNTTLAAVLLLLLIGSMGLAQMTMSNSGGITINDVQTMAVTRVVAAFSTNGVAIDGTNVVLNCASNTFFSVSITADAHLLFSNVVNGTRGSVKIAADGSARAVSSPLPLLGSQPLWSKSITNVGGFNFEFHGTASTNGWIGGGYAW